MASIDKTASSSFFPNSKEASAARMKKAQQARMLQKRNDPSRVKELFDTTKRDAKVDIADKVKDFAQIRKAVDAAPERDNSSKIARLKQQIQSGTYKIDYDAVADKLLSQEF